MESFLIRDVSPALIKNLRGIVYFKKGSDVKEAIKYLKKAFRYRILGVHKELFDKNLGRPFVELSPEFAHIDVPLNVERVAFESLLLSLFYVSPLIVLSVKAAEDMQGFEIFSIKTNTREDNKTRKLHLRVCDYSVIDWYPKITRLGMEKKFDERLSYVKNDSEKRFWRLKPYEGEERILFLDILSFVYPAPHESLYNVVPAYILDM